MRSISVASVLLLSLVIPAAAQSPPAGLGATDIGEIQPVDPKKFYKEPGYSPYAGKHYPERPLFGDEHVHTGWSVDAGLSGATPILQTRRPLSRSFCVIVERSHLTK